MNTGRHQPTSSNRQWIQPILRSKPEGSIEEYSCQHPKQLTFQTNGNSDAPTKVVKSRSKKKQVGDFPISFEQNLMSEHKHIVYNSFKNYKESVLKNTQYEDLLSSPAQISSQQLFVQSILILSNPLFNSDMAHQFLVDLKTEQKLMELLKFISVFIPKQMAQQLVYISFLCWQRYLTIQKKWLVELKDLLKISRELVDSIKSIWNDEGRIKHLCFKQVRIEGIQKPEIVDEKLMEFVLIFCGTVFVVIEEYFENPFLKRQEADEINKRISFSEADDLDSFDPDLDLDLEDWGPFKKFKYD